MLLHLRKGETSRTEEGHEAQGCNPGPRGGESWETIDDQTQLSLEGARSLATAGQAKYAMVRIVKTTLTSEIVE